MNDNQFRQMTPGDLKWMELYLAKAKEHNFKPVDINTEKGYQEAIRYLLVNGLIPAIPENLKLVEEKFFIEAQYLPPMQSVWVVEEAKKLREDWEYDEETELEELEVSGVTLEGVWMKQGKVTGAKIQEERTIKVLTTYHAPV